MALDKKHISRLLPEAREMLERSKKDRIYYIQQDRWLPYPAAERILEKLELMLSMPPKIRPPSLLICGDSHCGKSSLVRHFRDLHPPTDGVYEAACPVYYLETCPSEPDEGRLYEEILKDIMIPFRYSDKPAKKMDEVFYQFGQMEVSMIILDEIGNTLSGSGLKQRVFMNSIKTLHNKLKRPIVLVGTMEAQYVTNSDAQFASRFKTETLTRWEYDRDFQKFVAKMELTLPLSESSRLASPELSKMIFDRADSGCIGDFVDLVGAAAILAIKKGSEKITKEEILECNFTPSSKRQPPADRDGQ